MIKRLLLAGSVLTLTAPLAYAPSAMAQTSSSDGDVVEDVIVVTGSRIRRDPNEVAPVPIQSLDADAIVNSGEFNLVDVVNDIPALTNSTTTEQSIDSGFALGTNVLDLRGLGSARTLTLIDGRRSVPGVEGSAAVDISSVPAALVERVEVLTGGASAVYGADAVTGVVNFLLKDEYVGQELNLFMGANDNLDGEQFSISGTIGRNFDQGRGNIVLNVSAAKDDGLRFNESNQLLGGPASSGGEWVNPALRFQNGDITSSTTPNLFRYFNFDNTGLYPYGLRIPSLDQFVADYTAEFGVAPDLNAAERALFDRAANALARTVIDQPVFSITSGRGFIIPGNPYTFDGFNAINGIDLDGNGVDDCLDSFVGYNSTFSAAAFGVVGGCWVANADGTYRPVRDGVITGNFNGGGGDSVFDTSNNLLIPSEDRISTYLKADYDLNNSTTVFAEASVSYSKVKENVEPTTFFDLLFGAPDNPFLPEFIRPLAQQTGGVAITIDPTIFGDPVDTDERLTARFAAGVKGEFGSNYEYELTGTYGRFEREAENQGRVIVDRFFAAIDAVEDPATGNIVCRSTLDPTALPRSTPFGIPVYDDSALYSFTPGANSPCRPLNIWAGESGVTQDALDFIIAPDPQKDEIDQIVLSAVLSGDSRDMFELPAGAVDFVVGAEYRKERSQATFSDLRLGILPEGSPNAGQNIRDVSENSSLFFRPNLGFANSSFDTAQYDVAEVFGEVSVPIVKNQTFFEDLTLDGAVRFSDYSTVGTTTTWKVGASWTPVNDLRFRGTYSKAVRAPNIGELFAPDIGTTFRPSEPCSVQNITNAIAVDATIGAQRQANCITELQSIGVDPFDADGNYAFEDPLSAAFGGLTGGNPNLTEETADTITIGFVLQPSFFEGFTLTVDYWDVEIADGIRNVDAQDVVDNCYDGPSFNEIFCDLFTRVTDPTSAQFGGLEFLRTQPENFAALEAAGIDFNARYRFSIRDFDFEASVLGTKNEKLDLFRDPSDLSIVDPELGEIGRPEWIVNTGLTMAHKDLTVGWTMQYLSTQTHAGVEIDELETLFGPIGVAGNAYRHDIEVGYQLKDGVRLYGGVNNLTGERPFRTQVAYPFSPRGQFLFLGANIEF